MTTSEQLPLVAHVIFRLDFGGLENGLVNLINRMPADRYRHAIICITDYTDFRNRITRPNVEVIALHKRPGRDLSLFPRLWKLFRRLRPAIVHSRNIAALDAILPSWLACVPHRVHGEHGRDIYDIDGSNWKYQWLRRVLAPFIDAFVPLSQDLEQWLVQDIGIAKAKMRRICNGVDIDRFAVRANLRQQVEGWPFADDNYCVIGAVGRMQAVKDPLNLAKAFALLLQRRPEFRAMARLVMVGDGSLRDAAADYLAAQGLSEYVWLPGARNDVPALLQAFDVFVLPSLAEGISNTLLEAMATGLPVIATRVGGNSELIAEGQTGSLVPPADPEALAAAVEEYVADPEMRRRRGDAGRVRVEHEFSIGGMVQRYQAVYDELMARG